MSNVRARWNVPVVVGLGLAVAVSTALQAVQGAPSQQAWRPFVLLGSVMAGVVASWQLVAGANVRRSSATRIEPGGLGPSDPRLIGRYRIKAVLGSGAMGKAYLATDSKGGFVAIKTVRAEYADSPEFRRRFAREVEAIGRVRSRFTTGLVEADPSADVPWLVTPYVAGPSLQEAVERHGPWAPDSVWELARALAEALTAIHTAGIVHRDLKPGNVLLAADGPRIIDFGISRAADASQLTATMNRPGTPAFMAPEQALGQAVGPAADVFALGALLAYVATGRTPFGEGATDVVLFRIIHQDPDLTGIDEPLLALIRSCLDKLPERRPRLEQIVAAAQAQSRQSTLADETWLPEAVSTEVGRPPVFPARVHRGGSVTVAVVSGIALVVALAGAGLQLVPLRQGSNLSNGGTAPPAGFSSAPSAGSSSAPAKVAVPTLIGLTQAGASQLLADAGLVANPTSVTCADPARVGLVLSQTVPATSMVEPGTTVGFDWCTGPPSVQLPARLVNESLSTVLSQLIALGLAYTVTSVDGVAPKDTVIAVSPPEGSTMQRGDKVTITVSRGNLVAVPDVINQTVPDAEQNMTAKGLTYALSNVATTDPSKSGIVLSTDPPAGTAVSPGSKVMIYFGFYNPPK